MTRWDISQCALNLFWRKSSHCLFTAMAVEQHLVPQSPASVKIGCHKSSASAEAKGACGRFETKCSAYTRKSPLNQREPTLSILLIPHWQASNIDRGQTVLRHDGMRLLIPFAIALAADLSGYPVMYRPVKCAEPYACEAASFAKSSRDRCCNRSSASRNSAAF